MTQSEKFQYWLENDYDFGKFKRPLTSAIQYVTGLKSLNRKLGLTSNGIYDLTDTVELSELLDTIIDLPTSTKDEISHFRAYLKFQEIEQQNRIVHRPVFRQTDQLKKQQVETIAINKVIEHFTLLNYSVISKEKDNLGWDLEATNDLETLLLEVKGLSGNVVGIELTPNEYSNSKEMKSHFKLCIVTSTLTSPTLEIFSFVTNQDRWTNEQNEELLIEERLGARMRKK